MLVGLRGIAQPHFLDNNNVRICAYNTEQPRGTGASTGTRHNVSHIALIALNMSSTAAFQLSREGQHWVMGVGIGWCRRSGQMIGARGRGALSNVFQLCLHIYLGVMFKVENHKQLRNSAQHFSKSNMAWLRHAILFESRQGLL